MDIAEYIIEEKNTVLEAMNAINRNGKGIAYVCDNNVLKAAVTDGNIRRYILNGGDLNKSVSYVANYSPKYIQRRNDINHEEFMRENGISSVPILNSKKEIITIRFMNAEAAHTTNKLNVPVVIMAGGKGTRLHPITKVLPKPLVPINDKNITEIIMNQFKEFGCDKFNMIVNYKKNMIKAFFHEASNKYDVEFTDEEKFLGTGGGLKLLEGKYESTFFMTNCDILIDEDYGEIIKQHEADRRIITMVCAMKTMTIPYGTVELDSNGTVKGLNEKPSNTYMVNTGFYVINPKFFEYIPQDTFIHITEVIDRCIQAGEKVGVYPIAETSWSDMGQLSELKKMQEKFK